MYAYEILMEKHSLTKSDLPADALLGIKTIQQISNAKKMTEARGQNVSQAVLNKIKANDKWVVREILDVIDEQAPSNPDELPNEAEEVITQIKEEETPAITPEQKLGYEIDNELSFLFDNGPDNNYQFTTNDLQNLGAKKTYTTIFDNYEQEGENGITTSNYRLVEVEPELFTIEKQ